MARRLFLPPSRLQVRLRGQVYRNVPAPANLVVPRQYDVNALTIGVGEDSRGIA